VPVERSERRDPARARASDRLPRRWPQPFPCRARA
jgi:hypothetical protein